MAEGFFFSGEENGNNISGRRRIAELLFKQGMQTQPTRHWMEDAANAAKGMLGAYQIGKTDREQAAADREAMAGILGAMGVSSPAAAPSPLSARTTDGSPAADGTAPASLIANESGGNWRAQNNVMGAGGLAGHFGRLQFGQARLAEAAAAGAIPAGTTPQQFMASPDLQRAAERWHFGDIDNQIRANGLDRYIGQQIGGTPITQDGMRAVAHLGGNAGLRRFLESGGQYNPADANGTRLSDYLRRHGGQRQASVGDAVSQELNLRQPTALTSMTMGLPAPAMSPADAFSAARGTGLAQPGMSPAEAMQAPTPEGAWDERMRIAAEQDAQALPHRDPAPMQAPIPMARPNIPQPGYAPDAPDALGGVAPTAPQQAPIPQPRPVQVAANAPMPQPRPDALPQQAQPAGPAPMSGMSERDRLMLMRDEGSLAPGEADRLRGVSMQMSAPNPQVQQSNPIVDRIRSFVTGGQAAPATSGAGMALSPSAASAAAPAAIPPGADARTRLMAILMNPNVSPRVQQAALLAYQNADPAKAEQQRLALETARLANQRTQRELSAPMPNSPEAAAAQRAQREKDADAAGLTGDARRQFVLTGNYQPGPEAQLTAQNQAREKEADRLGLTGEMRRAYVLTGRTPENAGQLSPGDRDKVIEAEDAASQSRQAITTIRRALELNPRAYSGPGAGLRATIMGNLGAQSGLDTMEFRNASMQSVLSSLKSTFGANPTEGERKILLDVEGAVDAPEPVRRAILERALSAAESRLQTQQQRAAGIRDGSYFTRAPTVPPPSATAPAQQSGPRAVQTPAEAAALPPGTRYRTPDGKEYIR